jgi:hypothetical protein
MTTREGTHTRFSARRRRAVHRPERNANHGRGLRGTASNASWRAAVAIIGVESATFRLAMRLVIAAASLIASLVALAIALQLLGANSHNSIAHGIHAGANWFAGSFTSLFAIHNDRLSLLVNWGLALGCYLLAGLIVASLIATIARAVTPTLRGGREPAAE